MIRHYLLLLSTSLWIYSVNAHHSIEQDIDLAIFHTLKGTVDKVEWINPHAVLTLSVETGPGSTQEWLIQIDRPSALLGRGVNRNSLNGGSVMEIIVYPSTSISCSPVCHGYGLEFSDPNGRTLILSEELDGLVNELRFGN